HSSFTFSSKLTSRDGSPTLTKLLATLNVRFPVTALYVYEIPVGKDNGVTSPTCGGNVVDTSKLIASSFPELKISKLKPIFSLGFVGLLPESKFNTIGLISGAQTSTDKPNK